MRSKNRFIVWLLILLINNRITAEINLSPNASWYPDGITVAGWANGTSGSSLSQLNTPIGISISKDDVLYIGDASNHRILVVHLHSTTANFAIGSGYGVGPNQFISPYNSFVTNSSLYVTDVGNSRVQKLSLNGSDPTTVLSLGSLVTGTYIYVDNDTNIYLNNLINHTVLLFLSNSTSYRVVAGTGVQGSNNDELNLPYGVFVNHIGTIYIADFNNHRIMKWFSGATSGIRVAGNGSSGSSSTQLSYPTQIIVDTNEYMYISDADNSRIIRWAPNSNFGVCIAACTGASGTASTQLSSPHSLAFDSYGSLYVCEWGNHRVQKFQILHYHSPPYNQPEFGSCSTWNSNATTFADDNIIGNQPYGIFVNSNNTVYVAEYAHNRVQVWLEGRMNPIRNISGDFLYPHSIFVTNNGDVYIDNGNTYHQVDKWTSNATHSVAAMYVSYACYGLFVDIIENLYCSMDLGHSVVKKSFNDNANTTKIVAGNGSAGSTSNTLKGPRGIFVDINFSLYVADCYNNRIQLFKFGQLNGTTVATGTISLTCPTDIVFDADGYLFIADSKKNRIVGSGPNGFRCIVGCTTLAGPASDRLQEPWTLSFDNHGNLFVADMMNNRIQKFLISTKSCDKTSTHSIQATVLSTHSLETGLTTHTLATALSTHTVAPVLSTSTLATAVTTHTLAAALLTHTVATVLSTHSLETVSSTHTLATALSTSTLATAVTTHTVATKYSTSTLATVMSTDVLATSHTTMFHHNNQQSSVSFVPKTCSNFTSIGFDCNSTNTPCEMLQPCQNNATCSNTNTTSYGYICSCPSGFDGTQCQYDNRPCKPNTCWNNGKCNETSNITFVCSCISGWHGIYCETKINYCQNVMCLHDGVCRSLFLNYSCECLGDSYSGQHCEIPSQKITTYKIISKSFAYIAIIAMISVAMFVIIMDILKYCFGIDPVHKELKQIQQKKTKKKSKHPTIFRFVYVNSPLRQISEETISTIEETSV